MYFVGLVVGATCHIARLVWCRPPAACLHIILDQVGYGWYQLWDVISFQKVKTLTATQMWSVVSISINDFVEGQFIIPWMDLFSSVASVWVEHQHHSALHHHQLWFKTQDSQMTLQSSYPIQCCCEWLNYLQVYLDTDSFSGADMPSYCRTVSIKNSSLLLQCGIQQLQASVCVNLRSTLVTGCTTDVSTAPNWHGFPKHFGLLQELVLCVLLKWMLLGDSYYR